MLTLTAGCNSNKCQLDIDRKFKLWFLPINFMLTFIFSRIIRPITYFRTYGVDELEIALLHITT